MIYLDTIGVIRGHLVFVVFSDEFLVLTAAGSFCVMFARSADVPFNDSSILTWLVVWNI